MARLALLAMVGLASSALAAASRYRYGAARDRVLAVEPHAVRHGIARDFEVQDGLGVLYVRAGARRVARLVSPALAARLYPDRAPQGAPDGVITAGDGWLARGRDAPLDRMLLASARRLLYEVLPQTTWLGLDPLSSAIVQISEDGGVVGRHVYGPFGRVLASSGDADRHGFSGQDRDASGTLHFQFRQLDPMTGRWLSSDPLFAALDAGRLPSLGESSTAYVYVANNPLTLIDPTGLKTPERPPGADRWKAPQVQPGAQRRQLSIRDLRFITPQAMNVILPQPVSATEWSFEFHLGQGEGQISIPATQDQNLARRAADQLREAGIGGVLRFRFELNGQVYFTLAMHVRDLPPDPPSEHPRDLPGHKRPRDPDSDPDGRRGPGGGGSGIDQPVTVH